MNQQQLEQMKNGKGFIAALDQSGGSTPKALKLYGINEDRYSNNEEMFALIHEMRSRIIKAKAFTGDNILGAILFKITMNSKIDGKYTADFLWEDKHVVPILKVDEGLAELNNGVQLMKEMKDLDELLANAQEHHIFGTKMRSVVKEYNEEGIKAIVAQQFEYGRKIANAGLVPIIEPEVDIHAEEKEKIEQFLHDQMIEALKLEENKYPLMFKVTIPTKANLYEDLLAFDNVVRIVALSGGYTREHANELLKQNKNMIASFSRALSEGLNDAQSDDEFESVLASSIATIYDASVNK